MLWNKGNSDIATKIDEIREIVMKRNEFNFHRDGAISSTIVDDYNLELDTIEDDIKENFKNTWYSIANLAKFNEYSFLILPATLDTNLRIFRPVSDVAVFLSKKYKCYTFSF